MTLLNVDVDMRTLLLSQRVNKFFRNTIGSSTQLQKKLFMLPDCALPALCMAFPHDHGAILHFDLDQNDPVAFNPLLFEDVDALADIVKNGKGGEIDIHLLSKSAQASVESWQRMLLIQSAGEHRRVVTLRSDLSKDEAGYCTVARRT